ncbi:hypothetical protein EK21DRAFT_118801 [Setomelanomma holmii]|uniref:Uncharacterized protein n=1 Tax=Setomelanomma holmii TaxID=210430 RepID=A0A9P4GYD8_9PLEO|nr:hypothetical protein EK21DRAFT_118801 [Setomelanomma holmii]
MARIDDIKVLQGLQELILNQIFAIYGSQLAQGCTFAVITSRFDSGGTTIDDIEYTAQAIVYTQPGTMKEWKLLVEGNAAASTQQAMEMLYRKCQEDANGITEKMGVGWVYNGVKVRADEMKR